MPTQTNKKHTTLPRSSWDLSDVRPMLTPQPPQPINEEKRTRRWSKNQNATFPEMKNEPGKPTNKMRRIIYRLSNYSVGTKLIRMRSHLMLCVVTILSGCGASVVPAGPDTYMISTTEIGLTQGGRAKAEAYRKADEWCRARGLVMFRLL